MRKFAVRLLVTFCLLTVVVLGVDWGMPTGLRHWIPGGPAFWPGLAFVPEPVHTGMGLAALLLPLLAGAAFTLLGRGDSSEARSGEGDLIRLTPAAIERVVRRDVMSKVEDVTKTGVSARQGRRRTAAVTVSVAVSDRSPVPAVEREIRRVAAESLEQLFGAADAANIRVVVFDVQSGRVRGKKKPPKDEKAPEAKKKSRFALTAKEEKPVPPAPAAKVAKEAKVSTAPLAAPVDLPKGGALDAFSEPDEKA